MGIQIPRPILVADEEEAVLRTLGEYLQGSGFMVDWARDGRTAMRKIENGAYHLALLEVSMPGMDGISVLERAGRQA